MSIRTWIALGPGAPLLAVAPVSVCSAQGFGFFGARHADGWTSDDVAVLAAA